MDHDVKPLFYLQIVDPSGQVLRIPGGGSLERNLIEHLVKHILKYRVGLFVPIWRVKGALVKGIHEAILELKMATLGAQ